MKKIIFLIFLLITCPLKTISYCEGLEDLEKTYTIWDVLNVNTAEGTYKDDELGHSYELSQEAIFHINDPKNEGIYEILYDVFPVVKLDMFYLFNSEKPKSLGYIGSFEYTSLIYKRKQKLGMRIRTTVGYNPYH